MSQFSPGVLFLAGMEDRLPSVNAYLFLTSQCRCVVIGKTLKKEKAQRKKGASGECGVSACHRVHGMNF